MYRSIVPDGRMPVKLMTRACATGSGSSIGRGAARAERWPLVGLASEAQALPDDALGEQAELLIELPPAFWPIAFPRLAVVARELARRLVERTGRMSTPAMDRAAMLRHLTTVYGTAPADWWFNLLSGAAGESPNRVQWHRADQLETAAAAAVRLVQTGQNVYLSQAITDTAGRQAALTRNKHGRISTAKPRGWSVPGPSSTWPCPVTPSQTCRPRPRRRWMGWPPPACRRRRSSFTVAAACTSGGSSPSRSSGTPTTSAPR